MTDTPPKEGSDLTANLRSIAANASVGATEPPKAREYDFHPLANLFPLLEGEDFKALVEDIRKNGQREKIKLYDGQILDGRNRYRACKECFRKPEFEELPLTTNPLDYVISANINRRHLDESQRAIAASKLPKLSHGGDRTKSQIYDLTQDQRAKLFNVSKKSVELADKVAAECVPEIIDAIEKGKVKVSAAAAVAKVKNAEQQKALLTANEGNVVKAIKAAKEGNTTNVTEAYDKAQKILIEKLELMNADTAEAAAQKTIEELARTVRTKKGGKHNLKIAA